MANFPLWLFVRFSVRMIIPPFIAPFLLKIPGNRVTGAEVNKDEVKQRG
jgi:hypothetical protein